VKPDIALPLIMGCICYAPCEKVRRQTSVDNPVSICQLKKNAALDYDSQNTISLQNLPQGIYLFVVQAGNSVMQNKIRWWFIKLYNPDRA